MMLPAERVVMEVGAVMANPAATALAGATQRGILGEPTAKTVAVAVMRESRRTVPGAETVVIRR